MIDYDHICRVARRRKRSLPASIDWRDLAQEAALHGLMGRQSIDGPMSDLLRHEGMVGTYRSGRSSYSAVPCAFPATQPTLQYVILPRLERSIAALPFRYQKALYLRYWLGLRQKEIAAELGVSRFRVQQIHAVTIKKIKEAMQ